MNKIYEEYLKNDVVNEDNAVDIIDAQKEEIERLNNIIKEVREYIEKNIVDYITNYDDLRENLLDILKGSDKE